jgi:DNA sulfur modification protein DndD
MKIAQLTLHNFGPYKGRQTLSFPVDSAANVVVIFGDNMRGKTSLLNALRWAFFGEAWGRRIEAIPLTKLVNKEARESGDWECAVHLRFEFENHTYDLRRVAKPKEMIARPKTDGDFVVTVNLMKDGDVVRADRIEHELSQVMPRQVARFSLFDGELLQEYEMLLYDNDQQGQKIKESIEQVLGVPALVNGREELKTLLKRAQQRQARDSKHIKGLESQAAQFEQLQEEIGVLEAETGGINERIDKYAAEIALADELLAKTEAAQRAAAQIDSTKSRIKALHTRELDIHAEQHLQLAEAWRDLLRPRLQVRIQSLRQRQDEHRLQIERRGSLTGEAQRIRSIIESSHCSMCDRPVTDNERGHLGRQLGSVEAKLAQVDGDIGTLGEIGEELAKLQKLVAGSAMPRLLALESEASTIQLEMTRSEKQLDELEEEIRGHDTAEIARARVLRDKYLELQGAAKQTLDEKRSSIRERELKREQVSKLIGSSVGNRMKQSTREVEVYTQLHEVFSEATDLLRSRLREGVAKTATETFLEITTEPDYSRLDINDQYGLTIVDRNGRTVPLRSAGAEQVVALSLISGLNKKSGKGLPMIMDTPLGRLDTKHRARILKSLPGMAPQVILLVHAGEIDPETGLEPLADRIGAVFEIERVSASHSSLKRRP